MSFIDKMRDTNKNDNPYYDEYKKYVNPYLEQYKSYVPPKAVAEADPNLKPFVPTNTNEYIKQYMKQNNLTIGDLLVPGLAPSKIAAKSVVDGIKNGIETAKNTKQETTGKENVLGTAGRVLTSAYEGFLRPAEGVGDLINLGIGEGQKALGFNEAAEASKRAALDYDTTEFITKPLKEKLDPYAYQGFKSGQIADQIGQGIGQVGFNIGAGKLLGANPTATGFKAGATRMAPIFTSSLGSGTVEALNKGNSMGKSLIYGAGKGAIEAGSEALFGGLGKFMGKGALDDVIVGNITKSIRTPLLKNLAALGIKAAGEGIEENISGLLTPLLDRMLIDPNAKMYWQDENGKLTLSKVGMDFVVGMLTSLVTQSPSNIQNISVEKKNIATLETIEKALQDTNLSQEQRQVLLDTKAKITEAMQGRNYTNEQLPQQVQTQEQTQVNSVVEPTKNIENKYKDRFADGTSEQLKQAEKNLNFNINREEQTLKNLKEAVKYYPNLKENIGIHEDTLKELKLQQEEFNNEINKRNQVNSVTEQNIAPQNNGITLYRGGKESGNYFSTSKNIATDYANNRGGIVTEYTLSPDTKIAKYQDIPNIQYKNIDDYNVQNYTKGKSILDFMENDLEQDYTKATKWAKDNGYDAIQFPTEAEIRVINNEKVQPNTIAEEIQKDDDVLVIKGNLKEYLELKDQYEKNKDLSIRNKLVDRINALEDKLTQEEMQVVYKRESKQLNTNQDLNTIKSGDVLTIKDTKPQPKQVVDQRVAQIQETLTPKTTEERSMLKQAVIKLVDKGYYVDKLARLTGNKELSAKYDTMLVANGVASNLIGGEGFINENGEKIGKSLYETFDPVMEAKKSKEFNDYMYHRLNIDRMTLQDRGYGDNKPVFGETITAEYSKDLVAKYEKSNPEFKTWAEDVYKYNDNLLKRAIDNGILNEESYKYYKEKYPNYVPIRRVDTGTQTGQIEGLNRASVGKPIKVAKGGSQDLIPLKEAMAMNTISMERAGKRNTFANELSKTLGTTLEQQTADIENVIENVDTDSDLLTKGENGNSPTLTYYENGQKNTIAITSEIYDALETTYLRSFKIANKISNIRRGLITEYNLAFMFTNPIKDIQDGYINTKHPKTFAKNLVESAKQIKSKGKYYQMYIANGGNSNSYFNYKDGFVKQESNSKITYPLRKISEINKIIEMTPRLSEFISSIDAGDSIDTAMYNAAEITTNFKRGGDWSKFANKNGATFFNASIQGTYKQVKNVQQAISNGPRGIAMLAVRFALAGIPFTILNDLLWGDDDEYEELSDYVKDNYYIIGKYADGKFIRIPKGRVVGVIQKAIDNTRKTPTEGLEVWNTFLSQVENSILPNIPWQNNIASPIIDALTDKAWHGGDLTPMRLANKNPEDQWDESTDELSKFIGKNLGISPYKINYVLDQYSGVVGDIGLPAITKEAEQGNGVVGKALSPLTDKFTTDSVLKNQKVSDFYDLTEKFRLAAQKEEASYTTIDKSKALNRTKKAISDLYKEKREIQLSDLPDKEKYNDAREIQKRINNIANDAIIQYKGKIGE